MEWNGGYIVVVQVEWNGVNNGICEIPQFEFGICMCLPHYYCFLGDLGMSTRSSVSDNNVDGI